MDRWYDLNSWSLMYREEALREARIRHIPLSSVISCYALVADQRGG